jgi:chromosome segregation ATPase
MPNIQMKKLLFFFLFPLALHAADSEQTAIETKLREGLRNTMLQLRDQQTKVAELQAVKVGDDAKIKSLEDQLKKTTKQAGDDKLVADKTIADQKDQLAAQDARNARQLEALAKWKDAYNKLVDQAKTIDAKRASLANDKIQLTRKVEDQQRRNLALYDLGKEVLKRYQHYGLGDAITAKEPFSGIAKVKLENYVQDKSDALADQKIKE